MGNFIALVLGAIVGWWIVAGLICLLVAFPIMFLYPYIIPVFFSSAAPHISYWTAWAIAMFFAWVSSWFPKSK